MTASYTERFHGPTNVTSDQTAAVAIYNVDMPAARKQYCETIESIVERLGEGADPDSGTVHETGRRIRLQSVQPYPRAAGQQGHVHEDPHPGFYKLALALADRGLLKLQELEKAAKSKMS